jgi:hypothetical protein
MPICYCPACDQIVDLDAHDQTECLSERVCAWFATCRNPADRLEQHPVLGAVPACDRCLGRVA